MKKSAIILLLICIHCLKAFCQYLDTATHQSMHIVKPLPDSQVIPKNSDSIPIMCYVFNHCKDSGKIFLLSRMPNTQLKLKGLTDSTATIISFTMNLGVNGILLTKYSKDGYITSDMIKTLNQAPKGSAILLQNMAYKTVDGKFRTLKEIYLKIL